MNINEYMTQYKRLEKTRIYLFESEKELHRMKKNITVPKNLRLITNSDFSAGCVVWKKTTYDDDFEYCFYIIHSVNFYSGTYTTVDGYRHHLNNTYVEVK